MNFFGSPITWLDIIDLTVLTAVTYRFLVMMRGTRASQVLLGLFVIFVAYLLGQYFGLLALDWLMTHFVNDLFLILVVLFQNEIRRALAQVGRARVFGGPSSEELAVVVEEIVRACVRLSEQRVGALIVITRQTALGAIVDSGTRMDSLVSQQLLETIFHPKTPLHDGAVIIDGNRIVAAGCVLPLATEGDLPKEFGTRHRAALGMAQDTDAIMVVVSEERGIVSLGLEGKMIFDVSADELRGRLQSLLRKRSLRRG